MRLPSAAMADSAEEDHPRDRSCRSAAILALSLISRVTHSLDATLATLSPLFFPSPPFPSVFFRSSCCLRSHHNGLFLHERLLHDRLGAGMCTRENRIRGPRRYAPCRKVSARNHCTLARCNQLENSRDCGLAFKSRLPACV